LPPQIADVLRTGEAELRELVEFQAGRRSNNRLVLPLARREGGFNLCP